MGASSQVDVATRLFEITEVLYDPHESVQEEAMREFRKLLSIERNTPIQQVINAGVVPRFVEFLTNWHLLHKPDVRIISVALEGIENILKCGQRNLNADGINPFVAVVEMAQGVDRIGNLQRHENYKMYYMAVKILKSYFGVGYIQV